jgi:hypothetical protein
VRLGRHAGQPLRLSSSFSLTHERGESPL